MSPEEYPDQVRIIRTREAHGNVTNLYRRPVRFSDQIGNACRTRRRNRRACPPTAQDTGRWEVGAFTGGYFGSRTFLDQNTDIEIGKSAAFGLRGAFSVDRTFSLEATLSRASAHLVAVNPSTGASLAPSAPIDVNTYELNGLYGFGTGRMRGYMGLGVGAMTLHPFVPGVATAPDTRFVANVALGGQVFLSE